MAVWANSDEVAFRLGLMDSGVAIHDAAGVWINEFPFTPERVLRALGVPTTGVNWSLDDGTYRMGRIPAGEYYVVALDPGERLPRAENHAASRTQCPTCGVMRVPLASYPLVQRRLYAAPQIRCAGQPGVVRGGEHDMEVRRIRVEPELPTCYGGMFHLTHRDRPHAVRGVERPGHVRPVQLALLRDSKQRRVAGPVRALR